MSLDLGDFGGSVLGQALALGLRFPPRFLTQRRDFGFQVGQPPVYRGGARFGILARLLGFDYVFANLFAAGREEGSGVFAGQVTDAAREDQEIGPLPE